MSMVMVAGKAWEKHKTGKIMADLNMAILHSTVALLILGVVGKVFG